MNQTINLLKAVYKTMDGIDVRGIDNQDRFVGCANAIKRAVNDLEKLAAEQEQEEPNGDS